MISQVGCHSETEAIDSGASVQYRDGPELQPEQVEGASVEQVNSELRNVRLSFGPIENLLIYTSDNVHGVRGGVDGDLALLAEVVGPHIVQTENVVRVGVREQDGVQMVDACA